MPHDAPSPPVALSPSGPLSLNGAIWTEAPVDAAAYARLDPALHPAVRRILAARGFDPSAGFLAPSLSHLHDPSSMDGMDRAVARLRAAADRGERVRIVTDYDVDGTTSSLILQAALGRAAPGIPLDHHIPDRFTEGYGFSVQAAQAAARDGVGLIVTADIGVRDHAAVAAARAAGVDVLVCDHHLPDGADVPDDAIVLCPPQAACSYPNRHLAACGVSLKLAEALLEGDPLAERFRDSLLKLAAIGTIADLVPLRTLENRAIVHHGLERLNAGGHAPGLTALLAAADATPGTIDETTIGYRLGPRINAAGRMARATHVIDLLTTRDPHEARALASALDGFNDDRRTVQEALVSRVLDAVGSDPSGFVLAAGAEADGWHRGVIGIVAARVRDVVHRPVAIAAIAGQDAVGSVRSVPGVHAVEALDACADLLVRYGGHPTAAGFTVRVAQLDALRARLAAWAATHRPGEHARPEQVWDTDVEPADIGQPLFDALRAVGPFGQGNPRPVLRLRQVPLRGVQRFGRTGDHLKATLPGGVEVVWWRAGDHVSAMASAPRDLLVHLEEDHYRGRRRLRLSAIDAR